MSKNVNLHSAKRNKKDEFYTQLTTIENEMWFFRDQFKDKVIYCNCDDPYESAFFEYFSKCFGFLGLKKLIATCYKSQQMDLFTQNDSEHGLKLEYTGGAPQDLPTPDDIDVTPLKGDGDFRSDECIELLKEADIVITNPPFSLFREYVTQLAEYDKKFLIIGNLNAVTYKEVFSLIRDQRMWLSRNSQGRTLEFAIPEDYPGQTSKCRIDENGQRFKSVNALWYTNLDFKKRYEKLTFVHKYYGNEEAYPKYDNYDAIEVSRVMGIPNDYEGVMGVPITFLDNFNPEQFEIVGIDYEVKTGRLCEILKPEWTGKIDRAYLKGKRLYVRLFIRHRNSPTSEI